MIDLRSRPGLGPADAINGRYTSSVAVTHGVIVVTFGNEDDRQVIDYQRYGRTYLVGLSYAFN